MFLGAFLGGLGFYPANSTFDRLLFFGGGMVWMAISYLGYFIGYLIAKDFHSKKLIWLKKILVHKTTGLTAGFLFILGMTVMIYIFIINPSI